MASAQINQEKKKTDRKSRKNPSQMLTRPQNRELDEKCVANEKDINDTFDKLNLSAEIIVTEMNGQKIYGPPPNWEGPPPKGCEVFVGKLPRSVTVPDLVELFQQYGPLYEVRLMMDFSGQNRGYGFVMYAKSSDAQQAIRELHNYEIQKGSRIVVVKSMDNRRLRIKRIPTNKTENDIHDEMVKITEGVQRVTVCPKSNDKSENLVFVEYDSHKSAAMARRQMISRNVSMWDVSVVVEWAPPDPDVKVLFVDKLPSTTTKASLKSLFDSASNNGVDRVEWKKNGALVHFVSREQADQAKKAMHEQLIDGQVIKVFWDKAIGNENYNKNLSQAGRPKEGYVTPNKSHRNSSGRGRRVSDYSPIPQFGYPTAPPMVQFDGTHPPPVNFSSFTPDMMYPPQNYYPPQFLMQAQPGRQEFVPHVPHGTTVNDGQEMPHLLYQDPFMDPLEQEPNFYTQNGLWGYR